MIDMLYIIRTQAGFHKAGNPEPKGWSMKESEKPPLLKAMGGFCLRLQDSKDKYRIINQNGGGNDYNKSY